MTGLRPPGWLAPAKARLLAGWVHPAPRPGARWELLGTARSDETGGVVRHRRL